MTAEARSHVLPGCGSPPDEAPTSADSAEERFQKLRSGFHVRDGEHLLWLTLAELFSSSTTAYDAPALEIPKGRKEHRGHETAQQCAMREFAEEVGIPPECYQLLPDVRPLTETFVGINGRPYKYVYFVAQVRPEWLDRVQPRVAPGNCEVSDAGWFTFADARRLVRPVDTARLRVLDQLERIASMLRQGGGPPPCDPPVGQRRVVPDHEPPPCDPVAGSPPCECALVEQAGTGAESRLLQAEAQAVTR
jgi:8-oxo-dGTP pyrophosphatase MutT (NUDIX family)